MLIRVSAALAFLVALAAAWPAAAAVVPGPVAHWKLDGDARDASGHRCDGRAENTAPVADRFGREKSALWFNGRDSQIVVDPPPAIRTGQITVSLWVLLELPANGTTWQDIMDGAGVFRDPIIGQDDGFHVRCWQLWVTEKQHICWHRMGEWSSAWTPQPVEARKWYHVAASYDGTRHRLYLNGKLVHEVEGIFKANASEPIRIGAKGDATTRKHAFFTGALDDIRIYDRALSTEEVAAIAAER